MALLALAPRVGSIDTFAELRRAWYPSHLAWFALVLVTVATIAGAWAMPRRLLVAWLVGLGALVLVLDVAGAFLAADPVKVAFGAVAGMAFVRAIERPWWLLPVCVLVPLADAWSVFSERGVTNQVVDRAAERPEWILWPTIATPTAGIDYDSFGRLGIVDVLFAGLFLAAAHRWHWPRWRGIVALLVGLLSTSVLVLETDGIAVPALPLLCIAFVVAYAPQLVRDARAARRGTDASDADARDSFTE